MHVRPMLSQPAYSFYPEDEILHFYKWTSPPGVIRILSMLVIVMCIAIFACVASTLAWDRGYGTLMGAGVNYPYAGSAFGSYGSVHLPMAGGERATPFLSAIKTHTSWLNTQSG